MISCLAWVPKGAPRVVPESLKLSAAELEMLVKEHEKLKLSGDQEGQLPPRHDDDEDDEDEDDAMGDLAEADEDCGRDSDDDDDGGGGGDDTGAGGAGAGTDGAGDEFMKSLNMDAYDEEESGAEVFLAGQRLTYFASNDEDPYVTVPDEEDDSDAEENDSILPTDSMIITGRTEEEDSYVDANVYDESRGALFTHHGLHLPAFPLCLAWMNCNPDRSQAEPGDEQQGVGNFVAVGTFQTGIEIWDMDVVDAIEPCAILGGQSEPTEEDLREAQRLKNSLNSNSKKNKKNKKKNMKRIEELLQGRLLPGSHSDAVMSLSWHKAHVNRLASGSADKSIKLWDVVTKECVVTFTHHTDKVQAVQWNPAEPSVLLSGGYDRRVCVCDVRSPDSVRAYDTDADVECVKWNPAVPTLFAVSTETGNVYCHDVRKPGERYWALGAHNEATTSVSYSQHVPGLFATSSTDKTIKVWDVSAQPSLLGEKNLEIGEVFCMDFDVSAPFTLAAGGTKGRLGIWDVSIVQAVKRAFPDYVTA